MCASVKVSIPPGVVWRVEHAPTADEAMHQLGMAVRAMGWPLDRACLRRVDSYESTVHWVGVWARLGTNLSPGTVVPVKATSLGEAIRAGGPILSSPDSFPPLLDHILEQEGIRSWITIPLWRKEVPAALLSLSSASPDAFSHEEIPFLEDLGLALSDPLLKLTRPKASQRASS